MWSSNCGFDVYRGTCVRYGDLVGDVDYILVNGKKFDFDFPIEFPGDELDDLNENYYGDDYEEKWEEIIDKYNKEVCDYLGS